MRRYGDNVTIEDVSEGDEKNRNTVVMYGGCGVIHGPFPLPAEAPKNRTFPDILSILGLKRKKPGNEKDWFVRAFEYLAQ